LTISSTDAISKFIPSAALLDELNVPLLNMSAVFAQVQGDTIRTGLFSIDCRLYRIRIACASRLA